MDGSGSMADIPPSHTIYINNINEKVKKGALKKALYASFSQYGSIVDIVACKTEKLRGQAWIAFADVASATNAMKGMQGFPLYEKPMRIQFAKVKSHAIEKLDGTFSLRPKRARTDDSSGAGAAKRARTAEGAGAGASAPAPAAAAPAPVAQPSKKLLVQNLPSLSEEVLTAMLRELFGRYPGLTEVRVVAARRLAFLEFATETAAMPALQGLHNYAYDGTNTLQVSYAR